MNRILLLIFIGFYCHAFGQATHKEITIGVIDSLYSETLQEKRELLIHIPEAINLNHQAKKYPVLYLLDGETHFHTVVGLMKHLSTSVGNEICPEMIVVGITNVDRMRDLQPTVFDGAESKADNFTKFLEKDLIPYIDKKYPTEPYRMFVGHSIGGLRVVNTLVYHQHLFNAYLAIDPSLGHDIYRWYNKAMSELDVKNFPGRSLFIAMAQTMPKGMDTTSILKDTTGYSRQMQTIMGFSKALKSKPNNGLFFDWKYYPNESHNGVTLIATYDGVHSLFPWYNMQNLGGVFDQKVSPDSARTIYTSHFDSVSQRMGYKVFPPENAVHELANYLAGKKLGDKALVFYKLNAENYPKSKNALEALALNKDINKRHVSEIFATNKSISEIRNHLKKEAKKGTNSTFNFSETVLNDYGYELMSQNNFQFALIVFLCNTELYPSSANSFDSLGECLLNMGKKKESIDAYKKSLVLDPNNSNAKKLMEKLSQSN